MPEETSFEKGGPISLRPVAAQDEDFLLRVYSSTRMDEMALVPWNEAQRNVFLESQFKAQQHHYQSQFPNARHEIVERAGESVGRLYVLRTDEFMRILDLTILPEFRQRGIGTQLITALKQEAATKPKPLRIYVESFNPSLRLFERLSFKKMEEHGIHFLMEWNADE